MEAYSYFYVPAGNAVCQLMGEPKQQEPATTCSSGACAVKNLNYADKDD